MVQQKKCFSFLVDPIEQGNGTERVVAQKIRFVIQTINMWIAHMFKYSQTLGMFGDGVLEDIFLHQRDAARVQWHQFHHQVGGALEGSTVEGLAHQVSSDIFVFLGDFHIDCFDELALGWGRGLAELAVELEGGARDLVFWCHPKCSST